MTPAMRSEAVRRASIPQLMRVFTAFEERRMWAEALETAPNVAEHHGPGLRHPFVTSILRTCIAEGKLTQALQVFQRYGQDMPLPVEVMISLFRAASGNGPLARALLRTVENAGIEWTPELYDAAIEGLAPTDWAVALRVYGKMRKSPIRLRDAGGALAASLLDSSDGGVAPKGSSSPWYLGLRVYSDLVRGNASCLPDVLLQSLHGQWGTALAMQYLNKRSHSGSKNHQQVGTRGAGNPTAMAAWVAALTLLQHRPTEANTVMAAQQYLRSVPVAELSRGTELLHLEQPDGTVIGEETALRLAEMLRRLPKANAEGAQMWQLAATFVGRCLVAKRFTAGVHAANALAMHGQWVRAMRACTVIFAKRPQHPSLPTKDELGLCISASLHSSNWSAAMFWLSRGHGRGVVFPSEVYDAVFAESKREQWTTMLRVVQSMADVGGQCSTKGAEQLVLGAAGQGQSLPMLRLLTNTGAVRWKP